MQRIILLLMLLAGSLSAGSVSLTGNLDPSDPNSVFLYTFYLGADSNLLFQSYGYGGGTNLTGQVISSGGFDPYLTIFQGSGASATFYASNDDGVCPPGHPDPACADPTLSLTGVHAGAYTLALTVFGNLSFAENLGSGTLGDGFIGLATYFDEASLTDRTANFGLDVTSSTGFAPEPGPFFLTAAGAAVLILLRRKNKCS